MKKSITELKNKHKGEDIYVIGGGASCNFVPGNFFDNKTSICVNWSFQKFVSCDYIIVKEAFKETYRFIKTHPNCSLVISKMLAGSAPKNIIPDDVDAYVFKHKNVMQPPDYVIVRKPQPEMLFVSASTITSAIHLAHHMGAKNIILVGHDCGSIDGKFRMDGYNTKHAITKDKEYLPWIGSIENHTFEVKNILRKQGTTVMSLNPFINFGLEGHKYKR